MAICRGKFEIVSIPQGQAPLEVRKCWIGVIFDGIVGVEFKQGDLKEALTMEDVPEYEAVSISQCRALDLLGQHAPVAASWWKQNGFPSSLSAMFAFRKEECRLISDLEPLPPPPVIVYDMMDPMGTHDDIGPDEIPF